MKIAALYSKLTHANPDDSQQAGHRALSKNHKFRAQWHYDMFLAQRPNHCGQVAQQCAILGHPGMAKHYGKLAQKQGDSQCQSQAMWQLGQRYMEIAHKQQQKHTEARRKRYDFVNKLTNPVLLGIYARRQKKCEAAGMQMYLRAQALNPSAYGPHASRLRALLEQLSQTTVADPWDDVSRSAREDETIEISDQACLDEVIREWVATQTLLPCADELLLTGTLLRCASTDKVKSTIETLVYPLLKTLLCAPQEPQTPESDALKIAALSCLAHLGTLSWAATYVRAMLVDFLSSGQINENNLTAWICAHDGVAKQAAWADVVGEDLVTLMTQTENPKLKKAVLDTMNSTENLQRPSPEETREVVSHVVALDSSVHWHRTPLAYAISRDGVLNLDKLQEKDIARCDVQTREALKSSLTPEQKDALTRIAFIV